MKLLEGYDTGGFYDELFGSSDKGLPHCRKLIQRLNALGPEEFARRQTLADLSFVQSGVTFTVYSDAGNTEKTFPFDLIPRVIPHSEWDHIEKGLVQRLQALNAFLQDVYHDQKIFKDQKVPRELVVGAQHYRPEFVGADPPGGIYVHIAGSDLIRDVDGTFSVLEDNVRTPSGVSYVLENRNTLTRVAPQLFAGLNVRPVHHYTTQLIKNLRALSHRNEPTVAILTPGSYNSAYFEHSYLAQQLGIELVEGRDLVARDNHIYMKTTRGEKRVDVLYRRVDDDFLDPLTFRPDSCLGCPGLVNAYRAGNIALANSIGTGVADDKAVYVYVPEMIRYYLGEEPILPNIETYLGSEPAHLSHILANLDKLVVKAANESGGYGMLMGPQASVSEREEFAEKIKANPRNYIAQPLISLSRCPTFLDGQCQGRHVDLRPFALCAPDGEITIVPGGLTRVALKEGSYVVNSSQGGGSKDTWVLGESADA
ncbi:MAG: circularly permuted type 2 ATP-grasp protein [Armatimonas sp.]